MERSLRQPCHQEEDLLREGDQLVRPHRSGRDPGRIRAAPSRGRCPHHRRDHRGAGDDGQRSQGRPEKCLRGGQGRSLFHTGCLPRRRTETGREEDPPRRPALHLAFHRAGSFGILTGSIDRRHQPAASTGGIVRRHQPAASAAAWQAARLSPAPIRQSL